MQFFFNVILQRADDGAWRVSEFDPGRVEGELQRLLRGEAARPHGDVIQRGEAHGDVNFSHWSVSAK